VNTIRLADTLGDVNYDVHILLLNKEATMDENVLSSIMGKSMFAMPLDIENGSYKNNMMIPFQDIQERIKQSNLLNDIFGGQQ